MDRAGMRMEMKETEAGVLLDASQKCFKFVF